MGDNVYKIVDLATQLADPIQLALKVAKNLIFGGIKAIGQINQAVSSLSHGRLEAGGEHIGKAIAIMVFGSKSLFAGAAEPSEIEGALAGGASSIFDQFGSIMTS